MTNDKNVKLLDGSAIPTDLAVDAYEGTGFPPFYTHRGIPILYEITVKSYDDWHRPRERTVVAYVDTSTQYRAEGLQWQPVHERATILPHHVLRWKIHQPESVVE